MSLEKMAQTMTVISEDEMKKYWGMYSDDCFWKCVAYLYNPNQVVTEEDAEEYALPYTAALSFNGDTAEADAYLSSNGASISNSDAIGYAATNDLPLRNGILSLKVSEFPELGAPTDGGEWHAVILKTSLDPDKVKVYDPTTDMTHEFDKSELQSEVNAINIYNADWNL